jgi:hypothetical protein
MADREPQDDIPDVPTCPRCGRGLSNAWATCRVCDLVCDRCQYALKDHFRAGGIGVWVCPTSVFLAPRDPR